MDFIYINPIREKQKVLLRRLEPLNRLFRRWGWDVEIVARPANADMITVEQRINLFHLLNETLVHNIPGDVVELGCYVGHSATQIQSILERSGSDKAFHVFDLFKPMNNPNASFKEEFIRNFESAGLKLPVIHEGVFSSTVPAELPARISFAHIDCTTDHNQEQLIERLTLLLTHVYPKLSSKAVCLIMDYHDPEKTIRGSNSYTGVKTACDRFFADKPEKVSVLYGNQFPHGYFRKR